MGLVRTTSELVAADDDDEWDRLVALAADTGATTDVPAPFEQLAFDPPTRTLTVEQHFAANW